MSDQPVIQLENFRKAYDLEIAVNDLSFSVSSGQIVGLIGPNGSGKTTTLKTIASIIPSSGGSVCVDGQEVHEHQLAVKRKTAYVPDDPQLFNDLSVEQHFAFVASVYEVDNWQERMMELLTRFELDHKLQSPASDLSRGMRQKLAIGCAYLYRPKALLLDEPMTGLDPTGIRVLKDTITEHAAQGNVVLISSHLLAMVEDICSDVLILAKGKKKYFGGLRDLQNAFAAEGNTQTLEEMFFQTIIADTPAS